ncbi:hypothetical protein RHSIM_Rhsim06G0128100 [Rhododendron simsii]|uniref:Retrotransposon Copia-like N-terminal domain-containing protein n=1 Tax=Rhododendron simsii TaxID=118357 RepID=A0A834LM09_RHOSS|nr:hypothetical protein RHSIM_Rhsim06G0128100 [Rhododendron simsii]
MTDGSKNTCVVESSVGASVIKPELSPPVPGGKVTSVLLNGRNFATWSRSFRLFVGGRDKMPSLLGKMSRPADGDPKVEQWDIDNWTILGWFFSSMELSIFNMFMYHETADSLWKALPKIILWILVGGWDELAQYDLVSSDFGATADVSVKRMDHLHTYFFLMGLKTDFENLRGQILNISPLSSLSDTLAIVDGDERKRLISTHTLSPAVGVVSHQMAFAASSSFRPTWVVAELQARVAMLMSQRPTSIAAPMPFATTTATLASSTPEHVYSCCPHIPEQESPLNEGPSLLKTTLRELGMIGIFAPG